LPFAQQCEDDLQYGSRYGVNSFNSYGNSYGQPYGGGFGGGFGSAFGGGYSSMGYGGMNSFGRPGLYGGGYGQPVGPYGGPLEASLSQRMEAGTAATFQLLESIVGAFGGFAQMLESTYMATHSSFFAMIGVAEQFGSLRNYLGQVLSIFALIRFVKNLIRRLLGKPPDLDPEAFKQIQ